MKKAEDYLKPYKKYLVEGIDGYKNISGDGMFIGDVENAIKQAQSDAIDAAVKMCAEEAVVKCFKLSQHSKRPRWKLVGEEEEVDLFSFEVKTVVSKQSILQVADKLKKEL